MGQDVGTSWADTWMPVTGKLTALKVAREKRPGLYGDGGGLYLQVTARGSKSWIFRFWIAERDLTTGNVGRDPATNKIKGRSAEQLSSGGSPDDRLWNSRSAGRCAFR